MIGHLSGKIINKKQPGKLLIDVNGVGYNVETSLNTFLQLENNFDRINLHIHMIVREDAMILFGFLEEFERSMFRALIKINGIGPKVAMAILSNISPHELIECILQNNLSRLTKLPGIGKKTAERLLIEMKDKLNNLPIPNINVNIKNAPRASITEAISALEALGYKTQSAENIIKKIDDGNMSCEQLIRLALKQLSAFANL